MIETATVEPASTPPPTACSLPELLAPAGDWECAKAAVENGADAIYFGLDKFNARMRAHNFTEADLPKLMAFLHRRGVKGYVTFNTLVFENEFAEARNYLRTIIAAGVDAAIVQDVGICRLIREFSPDFPIHASTQMTVTSAAGVEFCRALGCNLVVLARECSIKEIEKIQAAMNNECRMPNDGQVAAGTDSSFVIRHSSFPLEVFIHGALCVAYSGQCLTSESLGGRSANRGECAQACRLPYELIADGKPVPLGDRKYLLSPQDLAGLEVLPELARVGVASLKIEGRLKSAEYVASITHIYRDALDKLCRSRREEAQTSIPERKHEPPHVGSCNEKYEMEMSFSRGLFTGWFGGTDNQKLVHARFGKKRGVFLGEVKRVLRDGVVVDLTGPLKPGDGVVFDAGRPEEKEEGGRVYEIQNPKVPSPAQISQWPHCQDAGTTSPSPAGAGEGRGEGARASRSRKVRGEGDWGKTISETRNAEIRFGRGDIDFSRVHVGDKLWKTDDPELDRRLRQSFAGDAPKFQRPVEIEVHGLAGKPLTLIVRDELGHVVKVASAMPLAKAEKLPLTEEKLREQLGRLGGTPFTLGALKSFLSGEVLLPVSELNRLRREAVAELEKLRAAPPRWQLVDAGSSRRKEAQTKNLGCRLSAIGYQPEPPHVGCYTYPNLIVLVRNLAQLEAALKCGVTTLYCEFEDPKKYREAVTLFHTARGCQSSILHPPSSIFVAPPRIFKPGDDWILKQVRSSNADGYLIRNYDHLKFFADARRVGDFSLNVANRVAADYFKNQFGLERVTASYDLNVSQLDALLQAAPPEWFEITIHQHMPMFHMEHCVFCAFLSSGHDYHDCGRPCDRHDVRVRDRVGAEHPLKADAGCRNTVFNSQAQTGAEFVERLLALGVRHFRLEFLNETPEEVVRTIAKYRQLLRGEISGTQLWRELKLFNQLGVTRGQMGK